MFEVNNIHKSFGEQNVLNGIDMFIEKGKIYTLVGGNGSGKTTLFNILSKFLKPDKGEILLNNERIDKLTPVEINKKGITRTFQDLRLITKLTVKENILLSFKHNPGESILNALLPSSIFRKQYATFLKRAEEILKKNHLKEVENNLAGEISYGQQKLLTIGCCLANNADLLLLDEPVAGIAKDNYQRILDLIVELKNEGKTILQIEHNMDYINTTSDSIFFLENGKIVKQITPENKGCLN